MKITTVNPYFLLIISIIFAVSNSCIYHSAGSKNEINDNNVTLLFNSVISLISVVLLIGVNKGPGNFSLPVLIWGAVYGIATAVFMLSKMTALSCGPIAITSLIGSCSLVIPTLFGIIYCSEKVTVWQIIGMVILLLSLVLCNKIGNNQQKLHKKWILWCSLFFVASGVVSVVIKLHQVSESKQWINEMMIFAYLVSSAILSVAALCKSKKPKMVLRAVFRKEILLYILLGAVTGTVYNRVNLYLTGVLPSIIFFPIFNGSVIFLTTVLGIFLYKEKLCKRQIAGILLGLLSILLVGNVIKF